MKKNILKVVLISFLAVIFGLTNPLSVYALSWAEKAPMPTARFFPSCILASDNQIYCIGGVKDSDWLEIGTENEAYNPEQDSWTEKEDMPTARLPVLTYFNGLIYAMGSFEVEPRSGDEAYILNEAYNPTTDQWTTKAPLPLDIEEEVFYSYGAFVYNNKIYLVGLIGIDAGEEQDFYRSVYEYDPLENSWQERYNQELIGDELIVFPARASIGNKIYFFGGLDLFFELGPGLSNKVIAYNVETNTFEEKINMPSYKVLAAASVGPDNKIYTFGGFEEFDEDTGSPISLNNTDIYDPQTDTWEEGDPMPTARTLPSAVLAANNKVYVVGGQVNPPVDINEEYDLSHLALGDDSQITSEDQQITQLPKTGGNPNLLLLLLSLTTITPHLIEKVKVKKGRRK